MMDKVTASSKPKRVLSTTRDMPLLLLPLQRIRKRYARSINQQSLYEKESIGWYGNSVPVHPL